jgi:hypothetical protein
MDLRNLAKLCGRLLPLALFSIVLFGGSRVAWASLLKSSQHKISRQTPRAPASSGVGESCCASPDVSHDHKGGGPTSGDSSFDPDDDGMDGHDVVVTSLLLPGELLPTLAILFEASPDVFVPQRDPNRILRPPRA